MHLSTEHAGVATGTAVEDAHGSVTHAELADDAFGLRARVPRGAVVVLRARRAVTVMAVVAALDGWAERVDLLGGLDDDGAPEGAVVLDDASLRDAAGAAGAAEAPPASAEGAAVELVTGWRLFTSGTTGAPKPVDHTLESLARTVRAVPGHRPRRWGLVYEPTRMAGVQVVLQVLAGREVLLDATHLPSLPQRLGWLADHGVEALSATPTMWRQVLASTEPGLLRLSQVTLGGEIADQGLLDALRRAFPDARTSHVFASTETGAAFTVSDGRAGFPRSYLTGAPGGVALEVRDGVLFVHAPGSSTAGPDGYASTGDLVEVTEDRVLFLGRASGVVNVGGVTVAPEQVEAVLRSHPGVADAVVLTRRNPFSGWILTARVVAVPSVVEDQRATLPGQLRAAVAAQLSTAHVPARVEVVDALEVSAAGKAGRR